MSDINDQLGSLATEQTQIEVQRNRPELAAATQAPAAPAPAVSQTPQTDVNNVQQIPGTAPVNADAELTSDPSSLNAIPYTRFKETIDKKNQAILERDNAINQLKNLEQQLNQQSIVTESPASTKSLEVPQNFETVEDLLKYNEKVIATRVKEQLESSLRPLKERAAQQSFTNNLESYFAKNKEASSLRPLMDEYTKNMSPEKQKFVVGQIAKGDNTVLDEIFHTSKSMYGQNLQAEANQQAQQDALKNNNPKLYRTVKQGESSFNDLAAHGKQNSDFSNYFQKMAQNSI